MKLLHTLAYLLIVLTINAQKKTDPAELYPVFKSIKVKWDKNMDYLYQAPGFNECINGNCADGEGVRLITEKLEINYSTYILSGTILKGQFSEGGNRFNGKVYKFSLPAGGDKKEKELRIGTPLDITDDAAMKPLYAGEGAYYVGPEHWNRGWDGEVKDVPALSQLFPEAEIHKATFNKGTLIWIDADLPARSRFIRYTGHTFASGDFMFGKAILDNGDVYEGFFLRNSFHGPGKLTRRSGKIQQGIWQVDSLTQDVAVDFPPVLMQATLPKPNFLKISEANEWMANVSANFYGEVINNEASGWGLWKADNEYAYGYWQHNQLDGPGIYFGTAIQKQFWINTGVYKNGKIVNGNSLYANYYLLGNTPGFKYGFPVLSTYSIVLTTTPLQGCALKMDFGYSGGYEAKPSVQSIQEGHYNNGQLSGFYFENDKEKKRTYEFLRFAGYNPYQNFPESTIKLVEASNDFCFDAMNRYKPLFVVEMKKKLEGNTAAEAWAKSPEGLAHKQRVELANQEYAAKRKKECDAEFAKIGVKGRTYMYRSSLVILEGYDCDKKQFIAWRPKQGNDIGSDPDMTQVKGLTTFIGDKLSPSVKQYETCSDCNGTGKILVTTTTTRTKELPFGYFSGIETKSIRTTTKDELKTCAICKGTAIVLK